MSKFDDYCNSLLEESKRFLEIAKTKDESDKPPYLRSTILISFSSLDAFIYNICDEFKDSKALTLHEQGFLLEREVVLKNGEFKITNGLKMSRLIERIEFLFTKFDPHGKNPASKEWWDHLNNGINIRNSIVHPKEHITVNYENCAKTLESIIDCLDDLFIAIYKKNFPKSTLRLNTKLTF